MIFKAKFDKKSLILNERSYILNKVGGVPFCFRLKIINLKQKHKINYELDYFIYYKKVITFEFLFDEIKFSLNDLRYCIVLYKTKKKSVLELYFAFKKKYINENILISKIGNYKQNEKDLTKIEGVYN